MEPGMDFHKAFEAIDTDHSGEISVEELESYCKKMNYKDTFVKKWLNLFDEDESGTISYDEYCNTLGLIPKQEVVEKHKEYQVQQAAGGSSGSGPAKKGTSKKTTTTTKTTVGRSRNVALSGTVVMQYSRARMFQRKALYRLKKKSAIANAGGGRGGKSGGGDSGKVTFTEKPIGGEKNGGKRLVPSRRSPKLLPSCSEQRHAKPPRPTKCFKDHKRRLRASITPGTLLIMLAGRHRGKRVVFLRQLASGLLLVTGPLKVNGCPLRRVAQSYVIATRTRINVSGVNVPERVNDTYFRRAKQVDKKAKATSDSDVFARQKQLYQLTQERRDDQKAVDGQVMAAIKAAPDSKMLFGYMRSLFSLKNGQKPHELVF